MVSHFFHGFPDKKFQFHHSQVPGFFFGTVRICWYFQKVGFWFQSFKLGEDVPIWPGFLFSNWGGWNHHINYLGSIVFGDHNAHQQSIEAEASSRWITVISERTSGWPFWECDKHGIELMVTSLCEEGYEMIIWDGWSLVTKTSQSIDLAPCVFHVCFHLFPMSGMLVIPWQHTLIEERCWIRFWVCHLHCQRMIANDLVPKMAFRIRESSQKVDSRFQTTLKYGMSFAIYIILDISDW